MDPHTFAPHDERRRSHAPVEAPSGGRAASEKEALLRVAGAVSGAHTLDEVLELAAEEARTAVGAASLAVSRWDRPRGVLRTLINVGGLGPGEERFPENETYAISEHRQLERMLRNGEPYFNAVDDPTSDAAAVQILKSLGKESDVAVPIITEGESWGEVELILSRVEFLQPVLPLVRHGHERWDGFGYPDGLAGEDIPLGARIIFACDAWDAMTSDRPYRAALHENEARAEMRRSAGSQFDQTVVETLLRALDLG